MRVNWRGDKLDDGRAVYEKLPPSIRGAIPFREWTFLSDDEKAALWEGSVEPEDDRG